MKMLHLILVVCGLLLALLAGHPAWANVLNMGGVYNPADGSWTGLASLETVPVGNVNNVADSTGYGSVGYTYNIGKYEVTAGQYTEFLNAVAGVDTNGLYNPHMADPVSYWGCNIQRGGGGTAANPYTYSVAADWANRPVNYVSYWDSCRFANWLQNGQPSGAQNSSTTEDGAYALTAQWPSNSAVSRNRNWRWAVPSANEWYKAAFYKSDGTNTGYWLYPTRNDTAPGQDMSDASGNNANYQSPWSTYAVPIDNGHYTSIVGQFKNSASPYGTFDQGGNVWEWNEEIPYYAYRSLRGGSFYDSNNVYLQASNGCYYGPTNSNGNSVFGLRVVQVPEPALMALLALGIPLIARRRRA